MVHPQLPHAFPQQPGIAEITDRQTLDSNQDAGPGLTVLQRCKPLGEWLTSAGITVTVDDNFQDCNLCVTEVRSSSRERIVLDQRDSSGADDRPGGGSPSEPALIHHGSMSGRLTPTDLAAHLACPHLTQLERQRRAGTLTVKFLPDPRLEALQERGRQHEEAYLAKLRAAGRTIRDLRDTKDPSATIDAMRNCREAGNFMPARASNQCHARP